MTLITENSTCANRIPEATTCLKKQRVGVDNASVAWKTEQAAVSSEHVSADKICNVATVSRRGSTASISSITDTTTALLSPNYDAPLKRHSFAASFGNAVRELGHEPGFKERGQLCDVHAYTDREKTSFLTETRGMAAFYHPPHAPSARAAEAQRQQRNWRPQLTKPDLTLTSRLLDGAPRGRNPLALLHGTPHRPRLAAQSNVQTLPHTVAPSKLAPVSLRSKGEWHQVFLMQAPPDRASPFASMGLSSQFPRSRSAPGSARPRLLPVLGRSHSVQASPRPQSQ